VLHTLFAAVLVAVFITLLKAILDGWQGGEDFSVFALRLGQKVIVAIIPIYLT